MSPYFFSVGMVLMLDFKTYALAPLLADEENR